MAVAFSGMTTLVCLGTLSFFGGASVVVSAGGASGAGPAVDDPPSGDNPTVLFASYWEEDAGRAVTAINDGGAFDGQLCSTGSQGFDSVQVVIDSAGTGWNRRGRVLQHAYLKNGGTGSALCGGIRVSNVRTLNQTAGVRFWYKDEQDTGVGNAASHHTLTWGENDFQAVLFTVRDRDGNGFIPSVNTQGNNIFAADTSLNFGEWFRVEILTEALPDSTYKLHPYIYTDAGALVFGPSDFIGTNAGSATYDGDTLSAVQVSTSWPYDNNAQANDLQLAQEGNQSMVDLGNDSALRGADDRLSYAGFMVCDTLCGDTITVGGG